MRLINTKKLHLEEFFDSQIPNYAILSHRWGNADEEISFEEYTADDKQIKPAYQSKPGLRKILDLCRLAQEGIRNREGGSTKYEWAWIDTICIDKRSSAELSEAINSMYRWYKKASVCLVFLPDVTALDAGQGQVHNQGVIEMPGHSAFGRMQLIRSTWFTRGWTLQELIAPRHLIFYDFALRTIGSIVKPLPRPDGRYLTPLIPDDVELDHFHNAIAAAAHMDPIALYSSELESNTSPIARIISWAAHRHTTRGEDMAYCLLGLCGVNLPLLYGEGGVRAFQRLQVEIITSNPDISIFAFRQNNTITQGMLAYHPSQFSDNIGPVHHEQRRKVFSRTPRGLEFEVRMPRGLRFQSSRPSMVIMTLSSRNTGRDPVHVLFATNPSPYASDYDDGAIEALRVGCFTSDPELPKRRLWRQVLGWSYPDTIMYELLPGDKIAKLSEMRPVSLRARGRELMCMLYPAKTLKVWVPLVHSFDDEWENQDSLVIFRDHTMEG